VVDEAEVDDRYAAELAATERATHGSRQVDPEDAVAEDRPALMRRVKSCE
jgi:hypothetical protein